MTPHDDIHTGDEREALLTAYALGETDAAQAAQVEALLADDAAARELVAEIRATAALLTDGFAAEGGEHLPAAARDAVTAAAAGPVPAGRVRRLWPLVGMAASVAAGVGLAAWTAQQPRRGVETAGGAALRYQAGSERDGLRPVRAVPRSGPVGAPRRGTRGDQAAADGRDGNLRALGYVAPPPGAGGHGGGGGGAEDGATLPGRATWGADPAGPSAGSGGGAILVATPGKPADGARIRVEGGGRAPVPDPAAGPVLSVDVDRLREIAKLGPLTAASGERLNRVAMTLPDGEVADAAVDEVVRRYVEDSRRQAERLRDRHGLRYGVPGSEDYAHPGESTFRDPADEPLSTFSIDVDTASYANVRRFLNNGQLPPPAAVRIEEMVNYFTYSDPLPQGEHPIAATLETATCPWNTKSRLVRIGVKAKTIDEAPPPANLVFLIDVSGSMQPADKLPLLQRAMNMLADQMREGDRVAIVTYASQSGVRLESTDGSQRDAIKACIDGLSAGGSTNGGSGILDAYRIARESFIEGGTNRVILATDGDFNVGVTDRNELVKLIESQREKGVFLSVLGVGTGNLKDATLESLADRGNGSYHYLDGLREARKVLVDEMLGTLVTVAKDVKIQIEFNPAVVGAYRLIGYENRMLAAADFNDDSKDAGEMGAGHSVTALYEIVPAGTAPQEGVDPLRYQKSPPAELTDEAKSGEMLTLKVRYKLPDGNESTRFDRTLTDSGTKFDEASEDLRFASAVASFGMLLRGSPAAAGTSYDAVLELAQSAIGKDPGGHRAELLDLVLKAKTLSGR